MRISDWSSDVCSSDLSGCGKSTVLRIAAGLEELQQGRVRMAEHVVADGRTSLPPEQRGVGLVFQDYALFPHLTALDNVGFGLHHLPGEARVRRAHEALAQVGMDGSAGAFPPTPSGGQRKRAGS